MLLLFVTEGDGEEPLLDSGGTSSVIYSSLFEFEKSMAVRQGSGSR